MSKEYDLDTYILHFAHRTKNGKIRSYNELLMNCIDSIKRSEATNINLTKNKIKINNRINIIYDCDNESHSDMVAKIIGRGFRNINLIKDYKNKGASGARNIAIENTIKNQDNGISKYGFFVILDNDMKVPFGFETNLVSELVHAEDYFKTGCAITYDQMPYLEEGVIRSSSSGLYRNVMKLETFVNYCRRYRIPCDDKGNVSCREPFDSGKILVGGTGVTYSGWRLSNFISSIRFFREAEKVKIGGIGGGFSSEELSGFGWEDLEWAIRVFKTPCVLLESHTAFVQHLMSYTSSFVCTDRINNEPILKRLLSKEMIAGFEGGVLWNKLRQEQMAKYGYKG